MIHAIKNKSRYLLDDPRILAKSKISRLKLASVAEQPGLSLTWLLTSEDRFSPVVAHILTIATIMILSFKTDRSG